jgi:pyrimidine-specific ribonucleoside hydrolase
VQPTVPYKKLPRGLVQVQDKKKVDYAIRALQGFEEKILETLSVKNK